MFFAHCLRLKFNFVKISFSVAVELNASNERILLEAGPEEGPELALLTHAASWKGSWDFMNIHEYVAWKVVERWWKHGTFYKLASACFGSWSMGILLIKRCPGGE